MPTQTSERRDALIAEILRVAETYRGKGDPDFTRQKSLDPLVSKLVSLTRPEPVHKRLKVLSGAWTQVWGPYDYRRQSSRGVDPNLDPDHIFQVISPEGYYWNVSPRRRDDTRRPRPIALLRGEYRPDPRGGDDMLGVRFTRFVSAPSDLELDRIWRLAGPAEARELEGERKILPSLFVKLFFGSGGLREVYTDETLRLAYGASSISDRSRESLYVMRRVG